LASYPFPEIELEQECNPDPHVCNFISLFDSITTMVSLPDSFYKPESILNPVPVNYEIESPIIYDHIPLMGKVCEQQFLGLDLLPEQILTLKSLLYFSQFPELVLVPVLPESKSIILSFHTPF